jgi:hypothetical protein
MVTLHGKREVTIGSPFYVNDSLQYEKAGVLYFARKKREPSKKVGGKMLQIARHPGDEFYSSCPW